MLQKWSKLNAIAVTNSITGKLQTDSERHLVDREIEIEIEIEADADADADTEKLRELLRAADAQENAGIICRASSE